MVLLILGPEAMNSVAASEQILKPAVSVSRKFLFSTKTCLCVTEVEHHIQELGQQLARLRHVECRYMFDMTILFCLMLELDRFLLTLLMSTIVNLTSSAPSSSSSTTASVSAPIRRVNSKVFSKVGQVEGAADLLASMHQHVPGAMASAHSDVTGAVVEAGLAPAMPRVPRGRPLMPARATAFMPSISQGASSAADAPPSSPVGERASSEADHDDDAM